MRRHAAATAHRLALALGVIAGVALIRGPVAAQQPAPQATFTARVDSVRVDVDVRRGDTPVAGLTAADFEILDNGVRQQAELVSPTALPLNIVLALDASASLDAKERAHLVAAGSASSMACGATTRPR